MTDVIHFLKQALEVFLWGPNYGFPVNHAIIGMLAALAAGSAIGGGLQYILGGKQRRRLRDRAQRIDAARAKSQQKFDQQIASTLGLADNMKTSYNDTAEQVYGQSIQNLTDRIQAGEAGTASNLAKAVAAGGGDVTGSIQATLGKLTEQSNKSITDVMNEYNDRVTRMNLQREENAKNRKSNLYQSVLGARQNQFAALSGAAEKAYSRSARKSTADKQMFMDALGNGANIAAMGVKGG